jgi:gluconokinase
VWHVGPPMRHWVDALCNSSHSPSNQRHLDAHSAPQVQHPVEKVGTMKAGFIIIMGVSSSGKTSVGKALAGRLGWGFYDADDFHPPANIDKMARGIPLTDSDRLPWLASLHNLISGCLKAGRPGVLACSALKESYRQTLLVGNEDVQIVYLKGSYDLIRSRMSARAGHYMKLALLESQFDVLEEPTNALTIDISLSTDEEVKMIVAAFALS